MRIGSVPDASHCLLLMLSAAKGQPALLRRRKQRQWEQEPEDFLRLSQAAAQSLAEEKMAEILVE